MTLPEAVPDMDSDTPALGLPLEEDVVMVLDKNVAMVMVLVLALEENVVLALEEDVVLALEEDVVCTKKHPARRHYTSKQVVELVEKHVDGTKGYSVQ